MPKSIALLVFVALAVAACGPKSLPPIVDQGVVNQEQKLQQEMVIKDFVDRHAQVNRVAFRVLTRNLTACEDYDFVYGALVMDAGDVFRPYRDAARYFLNIGDRPQVIAVAPNTPAQKAGLQAGDVLLSINGDAVSGSGSALRQLRKARFVDVLVERAGQKHTLRISQDRACRSPVRLFEDPAINAFALGQDIFLCVGIVKFVKSDDELGLVIGHELAHNAMKHLDAKRGNSMLGALIIDLPIGLLTGVNPGIGGAMGGAINSQGFETEADYVGLYYSARAGFDIGGVADMWRRMAVQHPDAIYTATTHPTTANRFVVLEATVKEIAAKRAAGQELEPNMRPAQ